MENFKPKKLIITMAIITVCCLLSFIIGGILIGAGAVNMLQNNEAIDNLLDIDWGDFDGIGNLVERITLHSNFSVLSCNGESLIGAGSADRTPGGRTSLDASAEGNKVILSGTVCDVVIKHSTDGMLHASFSGKVSDSIAERDLVFYEGGRLYMLDHTPLNCRIDGTFTVSVPDGIDFGIDGNVGDIRFEDAMSFGQFNINGNVAEIEAKNITADFLTIYGGIGEIKISGAFKGVSVDGCLGEIDIESSAVFTEACTVSGNMGEIDITVPNGSRFNFDRDGNMGSLDLHGSADDGIPFSINGNMGEIEVNVGNND